MLGSVCRRRPTANIEITGREINKSSKRIAVFVRMFFLRKVSLERTGFWVER